MQTRIYKDSIKVFIRDKIYTDNYTFFTNYEEVNGQPAYDLIFLNYHKFDNVVEYFFSQLVYFLNNTTRYENIKVHNDFSLCVKEFFVATAISSGNLSQKSQNSFESIKHLDNNEFIVLINEIKVIKFYFRDKYIVLFNNLRNKFGDKLQEENKIFLCPYCQRNYINIIQKDSLLIKADLDHFYPKAKYPFLAATLENLIPSCQVCNSRLKKEIDFYKIKHSNPLIPSENIFKKLKFFYLGNKNIYIKNKASFTESEKQYLKTFRIEEVYNTHTEILDDILKKNKKYNAVKRNHILKICPSMGMRTIKELVFHEYIKIDDKKVPMSRLKKSLFEKIVK